MAPGGFGGLRGGARLSLARLPALRLDPGALRGVAGVDVLEIRDTTLRRLAPYTFQGLDQVSAEGVKCWGCVVLGEESETLRSGSRDGSRG